MKVKDSVTRDVEAQILQDPTARRAYLEQQRLTWLGRTVRQARERAGMSQAKLAENAGMTQAELSRLENGLQAKGATFTTLAALSEALNFNLVFEFEPKMAPPAISMYPETEPTAVAHLSVREMT